MTAPSFISATATSFSLTTTPQTTGSIAVQNGDVLVAHGVREQATVVITIATATGSTSAWTLREDVPGSTDSQRSHVRSWTATATATGNITVSFTASGALHFGGVVKVWRNSGGIGNVAQNNNGTVTASSPTVSVTTTGANSALDYASGDWNAVAGTVSFTATSGTPVSDVADQTGAGLSYCAYSFHVVDAGAIGSKTMAMSSPTLQRYVCSVIEVKGSASSFIAGQSMTSQAVKRAAYF